MFRAVLRRTDRLIRALDAVVAQPLGAGPVATTRRAGGASVDDLTQLVAQLRAVARSQEFLLRASDVLAAVSGFEDSLQALAAVAVPDLGDLCLIDVLDRFGELRRLATVHAESARQHLAEELWLGSPTLGQAPHPGAQSILTGRSHWAATMTPDVVRRLAGDARNSAVIETLDLCGFISVPLVVGGAALGSVTLLAAGSGRIFTPRDLMLAEDLASRVALVVAKERRYDNERRAAHILQSSLLPPQASVPGLDITARYLPGNSDDEVGGDFYDVLEVATGRVACVVGDVAGHDLAAAAAMGQLRSAYRALTVHAKDPADMVALLHRSWAALGLDRTATAVFVELDVATGVLLVASAGHLPPLLLSESSARFLPVDPGGPLGAPVTPLTLWRGTLAAGEVLLFYTDGLVEDRTRDIDIGMAALFAAALSAPSRGTVALADHIIATVTRPLRSDDVALLILRRL